MEHDGSGDKSKSMVEKANNLYRQAIHNSNVAETAMKQALGDAIKCGQELIEISNRETEDGFCEICAEEFEGGPDVANRWISVARNQPLLPGKPLLQLFGEIMVQPPEPSQEIPENAPSLTETDQPKDNRQVSTENSDYKPPNDYSPGPVQADVQASFVEREAPVPWRAGQQIGSACRDSMVSLKSRITALSRDVITKELHQCRQFVDLIRAIDAADAVLRLNLPYCRCPCRTSSLSRCRWCLGKGWLTLAQFNVLDKPTQREVQP